MYVFFLFMIASEARRRAPGDNLCLKSDRRSSSPATAPTTLRHKVVKSYVPIVSPAPTLQTLNALLLGSNRYGTSIDVLFYRKPYWYHTRTKKWR